MKRMVLILIFICSTGLLKAGDYPYTWNAGIKFEVTGSELIGKELTVSMTLTDTSKNAEVEFGGDRFRLFTDNGEELKISYFSLNGKNENSNGVLKAKLITNQKMPLIITFRQGNELVKKVKKITINYMNYFHYRPYNIAIGSFEVKDEISKNPTDDFAVSDGVTMKLDKMTPSGTKIKLIFRIKSNADKQNFNFLVRSASISDDEGNFYTCEKANFDGKQLGMRDEVNVTMDAGKQSTLELDFDTVEYKIKSMASLTLSINNNLFTFKNIKIGS